MGEGAVGGDEDGGDDFVAGGEREALEVLQAGGAEGDDFAGALVAEDDGDEFERVAFVFVDVGAADAAALDLDEEFAGQEGGRGEVADLEGAGGGEDGGAGGGGRGEFDMAPAE